MGISPHPPFIVRQIAVKYERWIMRQKTAALFMNLDFQKAGRAFFARRQNTW